MEIEKILKETFSGTSYVQYNRNVAQVLGVDAAIMLGHLIDKDKYWCNNTDRFRDNTGDEYDGEYFHTRDDIKFETALSHHKQRKAEKVLVDKEILKVVAKPRQKHKCEKINWYSIDYDALGKFISMVLEELKVHTLKNLRSTRSEIEGKHVKKLKGTNNKLTNNKLTKNKYYYIPDESGGYSNNVVDKLELDIDEVDEDVRSVDFPAKIDEVDEFISLYRNARSSAGLQPIALTKKHRDNISIVPADELRFYIKHPHILSEWFRYCKDKSFDMNLRKFECNSDYSPSILFNESVQQRFLEWVQAKKR